MRAYVHSLNRTPAVYAGHVWTSFQKCDRGGHTSPGTPSTTDHGHDCGKKKRYNPNRGRCRGSTLAAAVHTH